MPPAPSPTDDGPEPAGWLTVYRKATLIAPVTLTLPFQGMLEASIYATNFDVLIDFSQATVSGGFAGVFLALYVSSTAGSGKVYRAQYEIFPDGTSNQSIYPTGHLLDPTISSLKSSGTTPNVQFILQAGGVAGLVWGLEACMSVGAGNPQITNLVFAGIAHGREL